MYQAVLQSATAAYRLLGAALLEVGLPRLSDGKAPAVFKRRVRRCGVGRSALAASGPDRLLLAASVPALSAAVGFWSWHRLMLLAHG